MNRARTWFIMLGLLLPTLALAQSAKVTAVVLDVKWRASATQSWSRARLGTQLGAGAQVRTGKRSKCEIRFPDGSMVRLASLSDLTIAQVQGKSLSMGYGKLYARIVSGTTARIQGGTGVASIKGTVLQFDAGAMGTPPGDRSNSLTIFTGLAELTGLGMPGAGQPVGAGFQSAIGEGGGPSGPEGVPDEDFFDGAGKGGWWEGLQPGADIAATPGSFVGVDIKSDTFDTGRDPALGAPGRSEIYDSRDNVGTDADAVNPAGLQPLAPADMSLAVPSPTAMLEMQPISVLQAEPLRLFGKRAFAPDLFADAFALKTNQGSIGGVRIRPHALWNNLYFEVGATAFTNFDDRSVVMLSEAFVKARPQFGDITVGRQHFLAGPVNNANLGSLIGFTTADALRFQHRAGNLRLDLAYVYDFLPHRSARLSGWYGRAESSLLKGTVGLNVLNFEGIGTGWSLDAALPLIEGVWDVYGEVGSDPLDNDLQTYGSYFPGLYRRYDVDVFAEWAKRGSSPEVWSLNAYRQFRHGWTGFVMVQTSPGSDTTLGIGGIKRFE